MPNRITLLHEAEEDIREAYVWYETQESGRGRRFVDCIDEVFFQLDRFPESGHVYLAPLRRLAIHKFPYTVHYIRC